VLRFRLCIEDAAEVAGAAAPEEDFVLPLLPVLFSLATDADDMIAMMSVLTVL